MVKKPITKTLDGTEFKLNESLRNNNGMIEKKHQPDILIFPFISFGIGSRLNFEKIEGLETLINIGEIMFDERTAVVTALYEKDGKVIIEAEKETKKEDKMKFVNKIVRKINFSDGLNNKIFINMLSNVFTDNQLKQFLKEKDLEIILFDGLMYLKVNDKAYRL